MRDQLPPMPTEIPDEEKIRFWMSEAKDARFHAWKLSDALRELLNDTQHKEHPDCDDGGYCPVRDARRVLADYEAALSRNP